MAPFKLFKEKFLNSMKSGLRAVDKFAATLKVKCYNIKKR